MCDPFAVLVTKAAASAWLRLRSSSFFRACGQKAPMPEDSNATPRAASSRSWASQSHLTVALGKITKSPKPVLSADKDWEVRLDNAYTSVYHDTKTNVTSIWYNSLINYSTSVGGLSTGTGPQPPCHTPIPCSKVPCTPAAGQKYRGVNCTGDEFASAHGIRPRVGEASETSDWVPQEKHLPKRRGNAP